MKTKEEYVQMWKEVREHGLNSRTSPYEKAEISVGELLLRHPDNPKTWFELGMNGVSADEWSEVECYMKTILNELCPDDDPLEPGIICDRGFETVGELISILERLPRQLKITPFGCEDCCIAWDYAGSRAYMDSKEFFLENPTVL